MPDYEIDNNTSQIIMTCQSKRKVIQHFFALDEPHAIVVKSLAKPFQRRKKIRVWLNPYKGDTTTSPLGRRVTRDRMKGNKYEKNNR